MLDLHLVALFWGFLETLGDEIWMEEVGHWGGSLGMDSCPYTSIPSTRPHTLCYPGHEQLSSAPHSCGHDAPPESMGPRHLRLELRELKQMPPPVSWGF